MTGRSQADRYRLGAVWTIAGVEDGEAVIIAGPFDADGAREYLVVPSYSGHEDGFVWTNEELRIAPDEVSDSVARFVGVWNARPVLEADLVFYRGEVVPDAVEAIRDAYWASLNSDTLPTEDRSGKRVRFWNRRKVLAFRKGELIRWRPVSGRVFSRTLVDSPDHDPEQPGHPFARDLYSGWALADVFVDDLRVVASLSRISTFQSSHDWLVPHTSSIRALEPNAVSIYVSGFSVGGGRRATSYGADDFIALPGGTFEEVGTAKRLLDVLRVGQESEHHEERRGLAV